MNASFLPISSRGYLCPVGADVGPTPSAEGMSAEERTVNYTMAALNTEQ